MIEKLQNWNSKNNNFEKYDYIKSTIIYGKFNKIIPKVTIMILTYKRVDGLERALNSALNQDYNKDYEIVVCDDSGYDEATDKLMKRYCKKYKNIVYFRHEKNLGQYANWNRACELCRTKWYCLLHDDDQLKSNYLTMLMECARKNPKAGLIGSYMQTIDERNIIAKERLLDKLINIFINVRKGNSIKLSLKDNIRQIYVLSCCLFINKEKALEIGGLDDTYFPSSDFCFAAKMNWYYETIFLPVKLSLRGIGNNESLKQSVCDDSLRCAFWQTYQMCKSIGYNGYKCIRKASIATVIAEIGVKGYNNVDYVKVKESLGMKRIYNNKFIIFLINLYSKFNWGLLLFRKNEDKGEIKYGYKKK